MGRAKLPIKLINPERSRNTTFTKRRKGLKKKMFEFSTLCDVDACMIIYGSTPGKAPETWPEDPAQVRRVIERFEKAPKEERDKRRQDISSLLRSKNKKLQEELDQRRRENAELTSLLLWNRSSLEGMDLNAVLNFELRLNSKIKTVSDRVKAIKERNIGLQYQGGASEVPVGSTNTYFECLRGAELRHLTRYASPLQSIPFSAPAIAPLDSHLHWSCGNDLSATKLHDHAVATAAGAPAYYSPDPISCMQGPAFAFGIQDNISSMAEGTLMGQKMKRDPPRNLSLVSHPRPYSLSPVPMTVQEDMDLLMGLTDHADPIHGFDYPGYVID